MIRILVHLIYEVVDCYSCEPRMRFGKNDEDLKREIGERGDKRSVPLEKVRGSRVM